MQNTFLALARRGQNAWWRYLVSLTIILVGWLGLSIVLGIGLALFTMLDGNPATGLDLETGSLLGVAPLVIMGLSLIGTISLLVSLFIAVRLVHQRPFLSLITPAPRVNWKRLAQGFAFFFVLVGVASLVEAALYPGRYELTWAPAAFFKSLPLLLVFVALQTTAEELVFRGYLMQSLGLLTRRAWIPAVASSFVFMLMHLANPEVRQDPLLIPAYYFGVGLLFALVVLRDQRLELTIGAHAATVLFVALLVNYPHSVLPTPAVFTTNTLDATYSLISLPVMGVIFYVGLLVLPGRRHSLRSDATTLSPIQQPAADPIQRGNDHEAV
jgi:hypothetical protein